MIDAIFIFFVFVAYHFVYESILAPSFRLSLRFRLFVLRDEVRKLKIECKSALDDNHFLFLQSWINFLIAVLHKFDIASLVRAELESRRQPDMVLRTEQRSKILDDCNIPRARDIRDEAVKIAVKAILVNSGAWIVFLAPIVLCTVGYGNMKKKIRFLTTMSGRDFQKISTEDPVAASSP